MTTLFRGPSSGDPRFPYTDTGKIQIAHKLGLHRIGQVWEADPTAGPNDLQGTWVWDESKLAAAPIVYGVLFRITATSPTPGGGDDADKNEYYTASCVGFNLDYSSSWEPWGPDAWCSMRFQVTRMQVLEEDPSHVLLTLSPDPEWILGPGNGGGSWSMYGFGFNKPPYYADDLTPEQEDEIQKTDYSWINYADNGGVAVSHSFHADGGVIKLTKPADWALLDAVDYDFTESNSAILNEWSRTRPPCIMVPSPATPAYLKARGVEPWASASLTYPTYNWRDGF